MLLGNLEKGLSIKYHLSLRSNTPHPCIELVTSTTLKLLSLQKFAYMQTFLCEKRDIITMYYCIIHGIMSVLITITTIRTCFCNYCHAIHKMASEKYIPHTRHFN